MIFFVSNVFSNVLFSFKQIYNMTISNIHVPAQRFFCLHPQKTYFGLIKNFDVHICGHGHAGQ